jgi:hypothetical protein
MQATWFMASLFHTGNQTTITLYILERASSWGTSWICPSWPQSRVRMCLLLVLFPQVYSCLHSCLPWPTQYLAICSNGSYFALNPSLAYWRPNTSEQVNNMSALHHIHKDTHIYITSILLFILLFTLLPLLLAGQLPLTLPVGHNTTSLPLLKFCKYCNQYGSIPSPCHLIMQPRCKPSLMLSWWCNYSEEIIDGQVLLVRLQTDNFRLFLC